MEAIALTRVRTFFVFAALLALAAVFAACGSSSSGGSNNEDPQKVLDQTFNPNQKIESANLDASLKLDVSGSQSASFEGKLSGPVDGHGNGVPKFDLTASLSGSGGGQSINFDGGITSTGSEMFVNYKGTDYKLDPTTYGFIKQALLSSQQQSQQQKSSLSAFKDVLTNLKNEGTTDVAGQTSIHITGTVDVGKLVDALTPLVSKAQALGAAGSNVPSAAQLQQIKSLVKSATFDVYSDESSHLLTRLSGSLDLEDPSGQGTANISFDITLGGVNQPQTVSAPSNAKPVSELYSQLGISPSALGALGALGAGSGSTSPLAPAPSTGGSTGGGTSAPPQINQQCLQQAKTAADLQKCLK
jgi:hypothetical protein